MKYASEALTVKYASEARECDVYIQHEALTIYIQNDIYFVTTLLITSKYQFSGEVLSKY
jgi:hypothetical protein